MKASVIIPYVTATAELGEMINSLEIAARGLDVEILPIEDTFHKGAAWARNRGLEKAIGDYVFFADSDDIVREGFFREPLQKLEKENADICFFEFDGNSLSLDFNLEGNANIRRVLLGAFLGYSMESARRWNNGGSLWLGRELGYVWRVAFSHKLIEQNAIRFDERMRISDDAAFLCECALYAQKTCALRKPLYVYKPNPHGIMSTSSRSRIFWDEKFAAKTMRERIDGLSDGEAWQYCEASCVFALLEMIKKWRNADLSAKEAWRGICDFSSDRRVREALRDFPVSLRHPLVALVVMALRLRFPVC